MDEELILCDVHKSYNINIKRMIQIDGGWLNQLWKASDGVREYIIKRYSHSRFSQLKIMKIEEALQRRIRLEPFGIPFPHIYLHEKKAIRLLNEDISYMVMNFSPGRNETPETISAAQMESLGSVCARMHKGFSQLPVSAKDTPPDILGLLENHLTEQQRTLSPNAPEQLQKALLTGESIFKRLSDGFFARFPIGFSHEDFTPDNILFDESSVAAVIDFDRNSFGYPWHDVGRAVLSFALNKNRMEVFKIQAFMDGYSKHLPLTWENIADALRLTWCIEFPWWFTPYCFTDKFKGKAVRYRQEIQWLTENWEELNRLQEREGSI